MELKPKPTKEQAKLIQEMYEYIMELMQTDLTIMVSMQIANCMVSFGCFNNTGEKMHFNEWFFYTASITEWRAQFESAKTKILSIINEVDIQEITDKNQNHGC